ncbi:Phosphatidylinositol 4-kinase pik1alpha (PI4-kinase)(PtdIns-4-kinase) [Elasticomyces elasticus]|nr:Phosphatidylinositol 4-kinase pik1alpha (PI4-kinase)(PtdIns-4-kinase) [Elasticomyces elasticus]
MSPANHHTAVIGNAQNFWLHSSRTGFDLTHPAHPHDRPSTARLTLQTSTAPVTLDPAKTALVVIDMQNFFLSPAFGRSRGSGHAAAEKLERFAIPAARKAGVRVVWLNWGLSEEDVRGMPPAVKRAFGFEAVVDEDGEVTSTTGSGDVFKEKEAGFGVDKNGDPRHQGRERMVENGKDGRIYKGLGSQCGTVFLPDGGEEVDAGRLLMRDAWNSALFPPLDKLYHEGKTLEHRPDVWIHKNRMSGMWGGRTDCQDFLEKEGIRSLLFTGVNTDQCVGGTFTDSFSKGYDCILLSDGCGTTSPEFAAQCIEFNAARTWGFVATCEDLARAADGMKSP